MSKRTKILLCIVAAVAIIGLATGTLTFGDIVGPLSDDEASEMAAEEVAENVESTERHDGDLVPLEDETQAKHEQQEQGLQQLIDENGSYTSKEDVALYIHTYGHLPSNFITKSEARELGWDGGSVEDYAPGCSIGGDRFGNYEGILPEGKKYTECDIDTLGRSSRGARRIVFSNDGCIYYTDDHYETFELLYGEE
ncbi:MAG: ribonuclease domain-containing protein [Clostridia bacterium]|nr:ribonuclease domain-containing protein [Clostridia bacterium]